MIPAINATNAPEMHDANTVISLAEEAPSVGTLDTIRLAGPHDVRDALEQLQAATVAHLEASRAKSTRRAYASDVGSFELWCGRFGLDPLPASPETVALYLTACDQAGAAVATLRRRTVAISKAHQAVGHPSPTRHELVRRTLSGIARQRGTRQRRVAPVRLEGLKAMLDASPEEDLLAIRDRAILLLGFAGGFRRSELAGLDVEDLTFVQEGVDVLLRRSKTDQEGEGRAVAIPRGRNRETCPVIALRRWLDIGNITNGPLFRRMRANGRPGTRRRDPLGLPMEERITPQLVARVVQRAARRAGLDPAEFAGHSLRAGFATEAAARGASERAIQRQTGHRSLEILRRYIREGDRYADNASGMLGL
jgi:site-specific recombinase XerD